MTPAASVVVPTCRRPDLLRRCLQGLAEQKVAGGFETIVVDDGHDGGPQRAISCVQAAGSRMPIRVLATPRPRSGPAAARNVGWRAARAPWVAFTDDDCVPLPGWLQGGVETLAAGADGARGGIIVPLPGDPTDYEKNAALLSGAPFATASCFYAKEALERVGGFDERFTMAWREDTDLQLTMLEHGLRLVAAPPATAVVHPVRPARWAVCLWQQRKTQFEALLYAKHPWLYRRLV
ncbi:MAG TPA: glycosyltransferase, partial [Candidatus Polarisedimenticolia bacterium]|nr:glycosyltransferase [Candidatus Polarisedimenticolia bacterium]